MTYFKLILPVLFVLCTACGQTVEPVPQSDADVFNKSEMAGFFVSNDFPDVGTQIRQARERKGFTQSELAKTLNLTDKNINNIETGHAIPTRDIIFEIQDALDCEIVLDAF